jgi:hypothetical protein
MAIRISGVRTGRALQRLAPQARAQLPETLVTGASPSYVQG